MGEMPRWGKSKEKGTAETVCDELAATSIPCPRVLLRKQRKWVMTLSPGRREGQGCL